MGFSRPLLRSANGLDFDLNAYHSHEEILAFIAVLASIHSEFVEMASMGKSFEGRDLAYLKVQSNL